MCISVRTCAYITHLLLAAIYYTKHLSFCDEGHVPSHDGLLQVRTSTKKREISQKSEMFPSSPKKKSEGEGEPGSTKKKKTFQNSTERERSFHHRPQKVAIKNTPRVAWAEVGDAEPARVALRVSLRKDRPPPLPGSVAARIRTMRCW